MAARSLVVIAILVLASGCTVICLERPPSSHLKPGVLACARVVPEPFREAGRGEDDGGAADGAGVSR